MPLVLIRKWYPMLSSSPITLGCVSSGSGIPQLVIEDKL